MIGTNKFLCKFAPHNLRLRARPNGTGGAQLNTRPNVPFRYWRGAEKLLHMFFVYVLYNAKFDRYYVGMTDNLDRRIHEHNSGGNKSTKAYLPWEIVYKESRATREEARQREKYLKTAAGRRWRKNNIRPRGATE